MIYGLLFKCLVLIAVIHLLRVAGRQIGPRGSGLILGLPSSTVVLLVLRGLEQGTGGAMAMAQASLLGLAAAVAMPLVYSQAVRWGWRLPGAMGSAVAGYVAIALGLGCLNLDGASECLAVSLGAILLASRAAGRIALPRGVRAGSRPSNRAIAIVRAAVPVLYVLLMGMTCEAASPGWAGLVSTFPGLSTVVLAVTHLEEGPAQASRIARTLPPANLSTAAFLVAFRCTCPVLGLGWAAVLGIMVALANTAALEVIPRRHVLRRWLLAQARRQCSTTRWSIRRMGPPAWHTDPGPFSRNVVHGKLHHRHRFAPRIEVLACS
jgi:hypothetical protein